jgi:hypothetical protein
MASGAGNARNSRNSRNCYCKPGQLTCGACLECGRPGHTRHHPGGPFTGAWCDRCFTALLCDIEEGARKPCALCGGATHSRDSHRCSVCGELGHRGRGCRAHGTARPPRAPHMLYFETVGPPSS